MVRETAILPRRLEYHTYISRILETPCRLEVRSERRKPKKPLSREDDRQTIRTYAHTALSYIINSIISNAINQLQLQSYNNLVSCGGTSVQGNATTTIIHHATLHEHNQRLARATVRCCSSWWWCAALVFLIKFDVSNTYV